jgi:hypothetical protein
VLSLISAVLLCCCLLSAVWKVEGGGGGPGPKPGHVLSNRLKAPWCLVESQLHGLWDMGCYRAMRYVLYMCTVHKKHRSIPPATSHQQAPDTPSPPPPPPTPTQSRVCVLLGLSPRGSLDWPAAVQCRNSGPPWRQPAASTANPLPIVQAQAHAPIHLRVPR